MPFTEHSIETAQPSADRHVPSFENTTTNSADGRGSSRLSSTSPMMRLRRKSTTRLAPSRTSVNLPSADKQKRYRRNQRAWTEARRVAAKGVSELSHAWQYAGYILMTLAGLSGMYIFFRGNQTKRYTTRYATAGFLGFTAVLVGGIAGLLDPTQNGTHLLWGIRVACSAVFCVCAVVCRGMFIRGYAKPRQK